MSLRNFQIKQKLGSGSYGVIYKVLNKTDKSTCVLKQISLTRMSEKARKNAANEAHIMGKLKHPFIVCYIQSFVEDNNLNILMEYCDGGDLAYFLKQQNKKYLKQQKIWKFFIQICMGLEHIHKNKILHRDIKTLNIFLNKNQMVKIGDLGVAKMLNAADFAHTMVGTPFYLSPELCQQKPYNQKSDIWALGCLLYELCTFKHPFEAANQASLILKIIRGKYEPIPEFYSKQLRQMIDMCLERDYKRRPTANMILSKPNVRKLIQDYQLKKIVEQYYSKSVPQTVKPQVKPIIENKPSISKTQIKNSNQKPKKVLDDIPLAKPIVGKVIQEPKKQAIKQIKIENKQKKNEQINQPQNIFQKKRQSQPVIRMAQPQKDEKPKILFGNKLPENKADFVSALQGKVKQSDKKMAESDKKEMVKKNPISFQIPWKGQPKQLLHKQVSEKPKSQLDLCNQNEGKIVVHNKNILMAADPIPQKNCEIVHRVKLEKKITPKVYEPPKQNQKPVAIIKSGGFCPGERAESGLRKKSESNSNSNNYQSSERKTQQNRYQNKSQQQPKHEVNVMHSAKNIRKQSEERLPNMLLNGKKQSIDNNVLYHYPPNPTKAKKVSNNADHKARPPKHIPHQGKTTSVSRFTEVTKEQQDLVANLPDIIKKQKQSQSDQEQLKQSHPKLRFNQIDDQKVLKMYEQMLSNRSSKLSSTHKVKTTEQTERQHGEDQTQQYNTQQKINASQQWENQQQQEIPQQQNLIEGQDSQIYYEVNKFGMEEDRTNENEQGSHKRQTQNQWSFDEEPELPMLEQTQTPLFEQANPYLVEETQDQQKKAQQIIQNKKAHLQIKLKQNIKREDQINRLMQLKIQQCKAAVPKNFDEILTFFRSKINMDRQYTQQDEKEVQNFLARRNLTDQRKFQNIYKIMHFQMELENTRRIIQSICKKLNQLQKQNQ